MPLRLRGPVGLRWRTQRVANFADDQASVIALLASIPAAKGGKKESWTTAPLSGPDGQIPQVLSDAIWDFQSWWKALGAFQNIDGVVDPGGHTLWQLNNLASGAPTTPSDSPSAPGVIVQPPTTPLDPFFAQLRGCFPHVTPWKVVGGVSGGAGVAMITAGAGRIDLHNADTDQISDTHVTVSLRYAAIGGSCGPMGFSYTYSTPSMNSFSPAIYSQSDDDITIDDLTGPMIAFTLSASSELFPGGGAYGYGKGGAVNGYFLGLPTLLSISATFSGPAALALLAAAARQAKGLAVVAGQQGGADASVSQSWGYATSLGIDLGF
jgi:hypothetical protein